MYGIPPGNALTLATLVQAFCTWRQWQLQEADVRLLAELQRMHSAAQHHALVLLQQGLASWRHAAACQREEAAARW